MAALSSTILRDVGAIARTVQSLSDIGYRALGLQKGQSVFLTRLCENPGINLNRLSELVRVDKTTTTKAVQKLEALGYVERRVDGADGRSRLLKPTRKALRKYGLLVADENAHLERCLGGFSPGEIRHASELLGRIRDNLDRQRKAAGAAGAAAKAGGAAS